MMKLIQYIQAPQTAVLSGDVCIHFGESGTPVRRVAGELWVEAMQPSIVMEARRTVQADAYVLNSLSADPKVWAEYDRELRSFGHIVVLPFNPIEPTLDYWDALAAIRRHISSRGIPDEALIVDLCIYPYITRPDLDIYLARQKLLHEHGLKTLAAFDNYIYKVNDLSLLRRIHSTLADAGLDYGLISSGRVKHLSRPTP